MRYSQLFGKTVKNVSEDLESKNAQLLIKAGFVDQLTAGVYSYLPLGLRVLDRIKNIVREEMEAIGGQEISMPALTPKEPWAKTGRWEDPGKEVMFQLEGHGDKEYALGWTHEEIVTPLVKKFVKSYKDLPVMVYQIQNKFRNEPRAKAGLLRGREFSMKDLYSFHRDEAELEAYYEKSKQAYLNVFKRCGLDAFIVEASGGAFSKYSHEFQVLTESGEDTIFYCPACRYGQNKEIAEIADGDKCPKCKAGKIAEGKAIEVGNIFMLKTRFTSAFDFNYIDENGKPQPVMMGCYGIGPSRVMGTVVEIHNDENGMKWPASIAPFDLHLIEIKSKDEKVREQATALYAALSQTGLEILYDDREDKGAGEKFADADLIGIPKRMIISEKTLKEDSVEIKDRATGETKMVKLADLGKELESYFGGDSRAELECDCGEEHHH
jgi:prolyl-tRNA synthetase